MSTLQQDAPVVSLPELSGSEAMNYQNPAKAQIISETVKPFFLYPKDGLYGLL